MTRGMDFFLPTALVSIPYIHKALYSYVYYNSVVVTMTNMVSPRAAHLCHFREIPIPQRTLLIKATVVLC